MYWHQLELSFFKHTFLKFVLLTHLYHSADYDTDHLLVCCRLRMQPKNLNLSTQEDKPDLNATKMKEHESSIQFAEYHDHALNTAQQEDCKVKKWEHLQETKYCTAPTAFGRKTSQNSEWFDAKSNEMISVIEAEHATFTGYKCSLNEKSLRVASSKLWQTARSCTNENSKSSAKTSG